MRLHGNSPVRRPAPMTITSVLETTEDMMFMDMSTGLLNNKAKYSNKRATEESKEETDSSDDHIPVKE